MPTNDATLQYDFAKHRYVLTKTGAESALNVSLESVVDTSVSLDTANEVTRLLERVSDLVYGFIYNSAFLHFKTERAMALEERYRPFLQEALLEQLRYIILEGDLSLYSGVNAVNGTAMDKKALRGAEIAPRVRDILINGGLYCPRVFWGEKDIAPTYQEGGY